MLRAGCAGFPVSRERYFAAFGAVELASCFEKPPLLATARRWREEAPKGFEFSLVAWSRITHAAPAARRGAFYGHFRPRPEVDEAWAATKAVAEALDARFVVFATPPGFYADADHLRDMYRFFKAASRGRARFVWQPADSWEDKLVGRVCADLGLLRALDPEKATAPASADRAIGRGSAASEIRQEAAGAVQYFRVPGGGRGKPLPGRQLGDAQLKSILSLCDGKPSYVFFGNAGAWHDARRFQDMAKGLAR